MHDDDCPDDLVEHIAAIEAGWTLPKPWKSWEPRDAQVRAENIAEMREMIDRWREHGIEVGRRLAGRNEGEAV